jgi:hypothetical protein
MSEALDILLPDKTLEIDGERITVREYGFLQGLEIADFAWPLIDELRLLFLDLQPGEELPLTALAATFGRHREIFIRLLSLSTDRPAAWVAGLGDESGQRLYLTWWTVNAHFFVRRLVQEGAGRQAMQKVSDPSTGESVSRG